MKKSKILVLILIFLLALSAFACSSGVNVDDFSAITGGSVSESVRSDEQSGTSQDSKADESGSVTESSVSKSETTSTTPFKGKSYSVTTGEYAHGSITVEGGLTDAKKGDRVTFIISADSGYELAWLKVNEGNDLKSKVVSGKLTVTMPEMNITVTALFSEIGKINNSSYEPVKDETAKENDLFSAIRETTQNGQFNLSAYNEIRYGNTVNITAVPNDGYKVKEVTVTTRENNSQSITVHGNHNDWAFVMPKANVSVKVTFEKELYGITVAPVEGVTVTLDKTYAYYGDEVVIKSVSLSDGYSLLRLEANLVPVTDNKFTMPAGNVTLTAFVEKAKYTASVATCENGTVEIIGGTDHEFGETVALNVTPAENYQLDTVTVTTESGTSVTVTDSTFVMPTENVTVTVTFKEATKKYSITVNVAENGTVTANKTEAVYGETVILTVTPDSKYELGSVSVTGTSQITVANNTFAMPESNVEVTVTFVKKSYTVTVVTPNGSTSLETSYKWGEKVTFTVTPDDNYQVTSVTLKYDGHSAQTLTRLSTGYEFDMPEANVTITVGYSLKKYVLTIDSAITNGTVTIGSTSTEFNEGDLISVIATPNEGYYLKSLTYNEIDITSSKQFIMPGSAVTVSAEFEKRSFGLTVEITSGEGSGSVTASSTNPLFDDSVVLTVTPANGFSLTRLSVDGTDVTADVTADGTYTFNMPAKKITVIAVFETKAFDITVTNSANGGEITSSSAQARYNAEVTLSIDLSTGYSLTKFIVKRASDGTEVALIKVTDTQYKFLMPSCNVTVTAETAKIPYTITLTVGGNGTATIVDGKTTATYGEEVALTITPATGYKLKSVTGVTLDEDNKFSMPAESVTVTVEFEKIPYNISTVVTGGVGGTVDVKSTATYEEQVTVTITPATGYKLKSVTGVTLSEDDKFAMPASDVTITVEFEKINYNVIVDETINGTASVGDKTTATYGEIVTITVSPADDYLLSGISVNGGAVVCSKVNDTTYEFIMPAQNVTVVVTFSHEPYTIALSVGEGGTVTVVGNKTTATYGEEVALTITPAKGYKLKDVTGVTIDDNNKFSMPAKNVTVTVEFEKIQYTLSVSVSGGNGTATIVDGKTTATYGEEVALTITPATGYKLKSVTGVTLDEDNKFSMPAESVAITVEFELKPYNISKSVGTGGTVTVVGNKTTATYGEEVALTITPATGYKLKGVKGVTLDEDNKFTMPAEDVTVTVEFEKIQYALSISVSGGNGTASIENNKTTATYGETVTVIATANSGYVLNTVTVNGSAISETSFSMPAGSAEIVVTFKNSSVTVSTGTCTNGSVSATPSGTVQYGATITLTATPSTGYELDYFTANGTKISGGGSTYTVTSNVEFKAVFKAKSYTLTVQHKCGSTVLQTETKTMTFGTSTTVNAKTIEGYTATSSSISVTMDTEGKTVTVSYTKNNYTLTVQHIIQGDGSAFASTETYTVAYGESKTVNPVSLTAYNGLIKASEGSKTVTMGASNKTVTYAYSLDTTKKFSSGSSTGAIPVITAKTGFSVTYKITDDTAYSIGDWCKVFSIKNANVFTGCVNWFDDNGTFVDDWFDGNHGHGNNDAYGTTYNYDAAIKEGCVYTISFNTDGSIDWYRNGLRVLYFDATTKNNTKTISDYVSFMISGAKSSGIKIENGAQTNDSGTILNKTNVSDCYIGYAIDKKTVTVSYSFSGTSDVSRGNSVYYMAPGFEYTFNTAMSGYSASRSTVVTGTGTSAESYSVTYTRSATTSTSILSTPVLVARKNLYGVSGFVKVNGISGDFFMQAKLTDVYQMQTAADSWRSILVGIYNNSNNSLGRYLRFDKFSWSIGSPYGEWTQGYNGMSSVLQSVMQGRSDILITITKTGTTVVVGYKVYSYAKSATYYMDFLIESVSGTVDVGFGGEDCTYTLEYINMENATGSVAVDTSAIGTTIYNKDNTNGGWTDGRVRTTIRTGLTGNFNATINLYQLTYGAGQSYNDAHWRTALLAIYGWCDYVHVTVLRQDGHWWADGGGDTGNNATVTSSDSALFTGNGDNSTGTKFADIMRNAYIQITVAGTNVGTDSGKIVVTFYFNSLNPDYKNTQYWLKYEISGVTRSHNDGYNTASVDLVMLCEQSSYVVYSYSVS